MKAILAIPIFLLVSLLSASAQSVITVPIEQYPPLQVVADNVDVDLPVGGIILGSNVTVEGGDGEYRYLWSDGQQQELGTAATVLVTKAGDYYLCVTDGHGCSVSVHFTVTSANGIDNPVSEINLDHIRIVNLQGQLVRKFSSFSGKNISNLNTEGLPVGVYLIGYVYKDKKEIVKQMIIK